MKRLILFIIITSLIFDAKAKIKVIAHFNFGKAGNVTYASAPEAVFSESSKIKLTVQGNPVFNADSPSERSTNGDGCILFNGRNDGYTGSQAIGQASDNMVFEVWVKASTLDHGDGHQNVTRTIVADGNLENGYTIAQRGKQWVLVAGPSRITIIGNVIPNEWVHLAALKDGKEGSVWMNGKQTNIFIPGTSYAPNFSIATTSGKRGKSFNGNIYEVRYSTFQTGEFDSKSDFLLNYKKVKQENEARRAERARLVKMIEEKGLGKEIVEKLPDSLCEMDWLIYPINKPCRLLVKKSTDGITSMFQLNNGLVSRTFYVSDNLACVSYKNLSNDAEYIRAVKPEARIMIDSVWYEVGGLKGQPESAYLLKNWYHELEASSQALILTKIETCEPVKRYDWAPRFNALKTDWPPKGLHVTMTYRPTTEMTKLKDIEVKIHYEIYQGIPVIAKWFEVTNNGSDKLVINSFESEVLAVNQDQESRIYTESDFSFAAVNKDSRGSSFIHYRDKLSADDIYNKYKMPSTTTLWTTDPDYNTWATQNQMEDKLLNFPHRCLLLSRIPAGPEVFLTQNAPFKSFVTFELLQDSDDKERRSLGYRRMYKKIAPQVTESLLSVYMPSKDKTVIEKALDQMAELKMERMETIGPGKVNHDDLDEGYVAFWKDIADYAKARGIVFGAYELQTASRGRGADVDCIDPVTGKPGSSFGQSVCMASSWKERYFGNMWKFFDRTGFTAYNVDGPYHGDICASTTHKYHRGLADSQWEQWKIQVDVIHECLKKGMRVQMPDWYFLNGSAATGMGYREAAANLTPQQQLLLGRQYIYDGTWFKLPTMGWMNLQLVGPYANDPRIGLLPLNKNLERYKQALMQYLASGCQSGILGPEVYDTPETKAMVSECLDWFRHYRDILTSEIIHVSRPNGRDLDCMLHVNPFIKHKGMVVFFNPTDEEIGRNYKIPLYYTGLKNKAMVATEGHNPVVYTLDKSQELLLPVKLKAQSMTWFTIE